MSERVFVTGTGAICAAGDAPDVIWRRLASGRAAIAPIRQWSSQADGAAPAAEAAWVDAPHAGEVEPFDALELVPDRRAHKFLRRGDFFGLHAARAALTASGLLEHRARVGTARAAAIDERTGVYVGSGGVGYQHQHDFLPLVAAAKGDLIAFGRNLQSSVSPLWLLQSLPNNVLCHLGIQTGFKGPNTCITAHGASGALALVEALAAIRSGEVDRAVVVGHDAPLEPQAMRELAALGLLAHDTVRPFDRSRAGTLLGEGAAALILEGATAARARGATIVGELLGAGSAVEPAGLLPVRDDGDGPARAMVAALRAGGTTPESIGMIVAHGNGTRQGDASEARAVERVFAPPRPPATAFKWAFGHTLAAAGILEITAAMEALRAGCVPGIATLIEVDVDCTAMRVARRHASPRSERALVLTRGFAGLNVATVIEVARGSG